MSRESLDPDLDPETLKRYRVPVFFYFPIITCTGTVLYLQELPLIHGECGGSPVQDLAKGELPTVGQDDRDAARLNSERRKLPTSLPGFPRRKNL
jgi:hypothetical protein